MWGVGQKKKSMLVSAKWISVLHLRDNSHDHGNINTSQGGTSTWQQPVNKTASTAACSLVTTSSKPAVLNHALFSQRWHPTSVFYLTLRYSMPAVSVLTTGTRTFNSSFPQHADCNCNLLDVFGCMRCWLQHGEGNVEGLISDQFSFFPSS